MKKMFFLLLSAFALTVTVNAQPGFQRRTVEERVKLVHAKLDSAFKPDAEKMTKIDSVFATYYRATDKVREDLMSGGERPDFQAMREKMQPFADERDKELKTLLTEEQYKKWKDEIEPALRPQRPGGNRNR